MFKSSKKIKVIHIIPDLGIGGAEKLVVDILKNYNDGLFNMKLILLLKKKDNYYEKILNESNIDIVYLNKGKGFSFKTILKLNKLIKNYNPHVIHTHRYVMKYVLIPTVLNKISKRFHTVHNAAENEVYGINKVIQFIAFKIFKFIPVAISPKIKDSIENYYNVNEIPLVYNGIDTSNFYSKNNKNKKIKIIHIGRFAEQKNHELLIKSFEKVLKTTRNVKLLLVGDGPLRSVIEKSIRRKNLNEYIEILGIRDDIPELLSNSDIFVLSSKWEGLPITILEAMACGLPIISTNVGGIEDIIDNNGILVDNFKSEDCSKAILELVKNENKRKKYSLKSLKLSKKYDISKTVSNYQKLYKEEEL